MGLPGRTGPYGWMVIRNSQWWDELYPGQEYRVMIRIYFIKYIYDYYDFYSSACSIQLGPYTIVTGGYYNPTVVSKYSLQVRREVIL